jgi:hypothetical protein
MVIYMANMQYKEVDKIITRSTASFLRLTVCALTEGTRTQQLLREGNLLTLAIRASKHTVDGNIH